MHRNLLFSLFFCVWIAGLDGHSLKAEEPPKSSKKTSQNDKISLIEIAPELYYTAKRYDRFYGDANTVQGNILERAFLFGNAGGARDYLVDHGFYFDFGVTQFLQGNVSGGDKSRTRYSGSMDGWLWFDTAKAGLWPGGAAFLHGDGRWDQGFSTDVGSLLPPNFDTTMPDGDPDASNWALSEAYLMQGLPANFLAAAGKIDMAAWADTNMFANRERSQFLYTGLVSNAIAGVFFPYTTLGAWLNLSPSKAHSLTAVYAQAEGSATVTGFDTLFNGNDSYAAQYIFTTKIGNRPGRYLLAGAYSTKDIVGFDVNPRFGLRTEVDPIDPLENIIIGVPVLDLDVDEHTDNYAVIGNFAQYLWVKPVSAEAYNRRLEANPHAALTHHNVPPVGIGVFGRAGWAPDDRNAIDQFYSFGIGGYGMLIPGRDNDQWGIGWAGSHISSDLRDLPVDLRSWEHGGEAFYNFSLTPAAYLSLTGQIIRPADDTLDTAYTIGSRLQLDF